MAPTGVREPLCVELPVGDSTARRRPTLSLTKIPAPTRARIAHWSTGSVD